MSIGNINPGALLPQNNTQITTAARPEVAQPKSQVESEPVKIPAVEETEIRANSEDRRFNRVIEAAKQFVSEFYPISDTRFTIFKDGSGQYITRFTNLKDGSVSYYPEPHMVARLGHATDAVYKANA